MRRASLVFVSLATGTLFAGCSNAPPDPVEQIGVSRQAIGEQQNGFPSPWERAVFMAANRARSDPSTVKGTASTIYPAVKPLVLEYQLELSSRFHATNLLSADVTLMHDSPCVLNTDVATSGCTGLVSCACAMPVAAACAACAAVASPDTGCGTDPFTRIRYFYPPANAEVAAAGFGDPWSVMDDPNYGWFTEAAGSDGHRMIIASVGGDYSVAGFGHAGGTGGCYKTFDVGDFGPTTTAPPTIASAAPMPISSTAAATFTIYTTWNDPVGGAPADLNAVVDGTCTPMTLELGKPTLNATYMAAVPLTAGCHSVFIVGDSVEKVRTTYPTTTAFTIPVGSGTCADEVAQPVVQCSGIDGGVGGADASASLDAGRSPDASGAMASDGGGGGGGTDAGGGLGNDGGGSVGGGDAAAGGGGGGVDASGTPGSDAAGVGVGEGGGPVTTEAGTTGLGGGTPDSSTAGDAGKNASTDSSKSGCACGVATSTPGPGGCTALAAAGLLLPLRRRRRARTGLPAPGRSRRWRSSRRARATDEP
jgi:hypothetical protein